MSLQPQPWPEPDAEVARAVAVIYAGRRRPLPVVVRDELGELFADEQFAAGFSDRGPRGWSPGRLMLVTVLQAAGNLSDRRAADAVRSDLSWKYALGLGLTDPGFDASILSEFRTRLVAHDLQTRALDLLVARLAGKGLLKAGGKQRTDSTHVLAAVRSLNWVELVGESVRACLEALAAADPQWTATVLDTSWLDRYGARIDGWRLPSSQTARTALANEFARDGHALLRAVRSPDSPDWLRRLPAAEVLRRVLVQNTKVTTGRDAREVITMRDPDTDGVPPARSRLTSPYDLDTRWGGKRDLAWNGYKLHISESCDTEPPGTTSTTQTPNLITNVTTTDASVPDVVMTEPIHHHLATRGLLPAEHYLDAGYSSAELLVTSLTDHGIRLITPILANTSTQARNRQGYDRTAFTIDWTTRTVTCPQGATSRSWKPAVQRGTDVITIRFAGRDCRPCPARTHCTTAIRDGRQLTLRPQPIQQALDTARTEQTTTAWQTSYARRAGIESTIAQTTRTGSRQARYRGLAKTSLEHNIKATAINLIRLNAWWHGDNLHPRPTSHLTRLNLALAA